MFTLPRKPESESRFFGLRMPELCLVIILDTQFILSGTHNSFFLGHEFFLHEIKGALMMKFSDSRFEEKPAMRLQ